MCQDTGRRAWVGQRLNVFSAVQVVGELCQSGAKIGVVTRSSSSPHASGIWCFVILTQPQLLVRVRAGAGMIDGFPLAYETRVPRLLSILFRAATKIGGAGGDMVHQL
jgi:hypothetical protein